MRSSIHIVVVILAFGMPIAASAQKPSAYPAKDQSAEQQGKDDAQCLAWAKQNTGIDPAAVAATPPPPTEPQGERAVGAVRGAAAGALIGDSSKSARTGATVGVLAGGRQARKNQAAQAQQAQASKTQAMDTYYRAYRGCMQGRGYIVN